MTSDLKLLRVRFMQPAEIKGIGMVDHLELADDPETGMPITPGVSAKIVELFGIPWVRVVTAKGETLIPVEGAVASLQPLYEARPNTTPVAKRAVK